MLNTIISIKIYLFYTKEYAIYWSQPKEIPPAVKSQLLFLSRWRKYL